MCCNMQKKNIIRENNFLKEIYLSLKEMKIKIFFPTLTVELQMLHITASRNRAVFDFGRLFWLLFFRKKSNTTLILYAEVNTVFNNNPAINNN